MTAGEFQLRDRNDRLLLRHARAAGGFWERLLGLMGRGSLGQDECLLIRSCGSIHTFFMRFPIDVAFLDGDGHVLSIREGLRPWRVAGPVRGARAVIEFPDGCLNRLEIGEGYEFGDLP